MPDKDTKQGAQRDPSQPKPGAQAPPAGSPASQATPAAAAPGAPAPTLEQELESLCASMEKFLRRALGQMPSSAELAELHAQQASVRDLFRRAQERGAQSETKLTELSAERDRFKDAAARARADFLNYQTRAANDLRRAEEQALRDFVSDLLPVLDSLDRAVRDAEQAQLPAPLQEATQQQLKQASKEELGEAEAGGEEARQLALLRVAHAALMMREALLQVMRVRGLERIQAVGKPFDPRLHEAVVVRPADAARNEQAGQVVEELRPGYLWKGLPLRSAQIVITSAAKPPEPRA
jgi:molecular chaperone GrpE